MKDDFGDRMKRYEQATKLVLPPRTFTIVRVDGRTFHTYLRHAHKPFDQSVIVAMDSAAVALCKEISGACFAYTQSDEISVLITDLDPRHQPWFAGEVQKLASVAASIATAEFNDTYKMIQQPSQISGGHATFDARVYTIPSRIEVANYFLWRQKDAIRNAVSMAAHAQIPQRELQGVGVAQMQEMLFQREGLNFKTAYSDRERRGGVVTREGYTVETSLPVRKIGRQHRGKVVRGERLPITAVRHRWIASASEDFTLANGGFLARSIPAEPNDALQPEVPACEHEAWESTPNGIPHQCADCKHVFTMRESNERRERAE